MDQKLKHLEFIQNVINRMANTSFLLKGWSVTVVAGLFALGINSQARALLSLTAFMALVFWGLDAYFLRQERLFRALYDDVRVKTETSIDFAMDTTAFATHPRNSFSECVWSVTLGWFYGPLVTLAVLLALTQCLP